MDYRLDYLIDVALADQSSMAIDTKYRVTAHPTQASPNSNTIRRAMTQQDKRSTQKRDSIRNIVSFQNKRKKVTIRPATSMMLFGIMEGQTFEGGHGSVRELELAGNYKNRYSVVLVLYNSRISSQSYCTLYHLRICVVRAKSLPQPLSRVHLSSVLHTSF